MGAEDVGALVVRGLTGPVSGRAWEVTPASPLVLGRAVSDPRGGVAVIIPDLRISSEHCRIEYAGGAYRVVDLNSRNGVCVNGRRIPRGGSQALHDGDIVALAEVALEICMGRPGDSGSFSGVLTDTDTQTRITGSGRDTGSPALVPDLLPFPVAMSVRSVRSALGALERVCETFRSFEVMLRFQTLVCLSEYLAGERRDGKTQDILAAFCDRPFTLGRWLELFMALTRAVADDPDLVVPEFTALAGDDDGARRWNAAASRLIELRNTLFHGDGIRAGTTEIIDPEVAILFERACSGFAFWMGYRCIAVEPGAWSDDRSVFAYPCSLLLGCATPFEGRLLRSRDPLPSRVPIVLSRNGERRLSLAPFQALLPAEDKQLRWSLLSEMNGKRAVFKSFAAPIEAAAPDIALIRSLLCGRRGPTKARAPFSGRLLSK